MTELNEKNVGELVDSMKGLRCDHHAVLIIDECSKPFTLRQILELLRKNSKATLADVGIGDQAASGCVTKKINHRIRDPKNKPPVPLYTARTPIATVVGDACR